MTKADLVEQVAEKTGLTRTDVAVVVDSFLDTIKKTMEDGHNIEIRGFGTFKIKLRKARKARNPRFYRLQSLSWSGIDSGASAQCNHLELRHLVFRNTLFKFSYINWFYFGCRYCICFFAWQ